MANLEQLDNEAQQYFYSLPIIIQEEIIQSGVKLKSKQDIENCYQNIITNRASDVN